MKTLKDRKRDLLKRWRELDARMHDIDVELLSHQSRDWEELAVEREGDEVLESLGASGDLEVRQIRAALSRIEAGTYGECARCGDDIAAERLDALPQTPLCQSCAAAKSA